MTVDVKDQNKPKRRRGRPRKNFTTGEKSRSQRPKRTPIHEQRSKLTTLGIPDGYRGLWIRTPSESDQKIGMYIDAGWEFARSDQIEVGESWVYKSQHVGGSIIRRPAGGYDGDWLYLMIIPEEYYVEDAQHMYDEIDERERGMLRGETDKAGGLVEDETTHYGGTKIERHKG